jgi:hypothetical protein
VFAWTVYQTLNHLTYFNFWHECYATRGHANFILFDFNSEADTRNYGAESKLVSHNKTHSNKSSEEKILNAKYKDFKFHREYR